MSEATELPLAQMSGTVYPEFESIVQRIIKGIDQDTLADLRRDFHMRLRITLTHPDRAELIEDLWDFFYDWCLFERKLPDSISTLPQNIQTEWMSVKEGSIRGLYEVSKITDVYLKAKELFTGDVVELHKKTAIDFLGISRGDIIEGRLMKVGGTKKIFFNFVRKPSFHPVQVHEYIKKKVKEFKRAKDFKTYQNWLWLLVGMYLKHRIYQHMPIEKIYDDNSRI